MERIIYEIKPIFCLALGAYALQVHNLPRLGRVPAMVLITCGMLMIVWRYQWRTVSNKKRVQAPKNR